jgi:hypothetical protein
MGPTAPDASIPATSDSFVADQVLRRLLSSIARTDRRVARSQAMVSESIELVALSQEALARSAQILAPEQAWPTRRGPVRPASGRG